MRLKHKSLFHTMTETEFNQAVEKLDAVIPALNVSRIRASFGQTVVAVPGVLSPPTFSKHPPPSKSSGRVILFQHRGDNAGSGCAFKRAFFPWPSRTVQCPVQRYRSADRPPC